MWGRKKRERIGYPRLYATVKEYGDVIVRCSSRPPVEVEADIWAGRAPEVLDATSIWYYGPQMIRVRTSEIVATVIRED